MWWMKILAKLFLSRLPFGYWVWQKIGLFRHGYMDNSDYAIRIFNSHVTKAGIFKKLSGITVLELGPGDSIATAIIAASYGAKSILIDSGNFVSSDMNSYLRLHSKLLELGALPPDISSCNSIQDILKQCNSTYLSNGLVDLKTIQTKSVDLIFSQAVLEHVRFHEFEETLSECNRILRDDGVCSHSIDLKDHLGGALNNLRFPFSVWESNFFSQSGFYTNRIRFKRMLALFSRSGFKYEVINVENWDCLPIKRNQMMPEFALLENDDILISEFDVLLRK